MANRVLLGMAGDTPRLRVSRPGFDATNLALGPEQICFDSAWSEILTVYKASWAATLPAGADSVVFGGNTWSLPYRTLSYGETLPVAPIVMAWTRQAGVYITWLNATNNTAYMGASAMTLYPAMTASYQDRALISTIGASPNDGVAYIVFHQRVDAYDDREASGSTNRVLLGIHPTRGGGLFVSRAGADVLTCGDADLALSSTKLPFQAAEAGSYTPTARRTVGTSSRNPNGLYSWIDFINLSGSYPDYPPVIVSTSKIGSMEPLPSKSDIKVHWTSSSQICIEVAGDWAPAAIPAGATIQWLIPSYDPAYSPPSSSASTNRIHLTPETGLRISKPGINVLTAADADLILDTSRSMLHVSSRGVIPNPGTLSSGVESISSIASLMPLTLFSSYTFGRWWSFPNYIAVEAERWQGAMKFVGTQSWAFVGQSGIAWKFYATSQTTEIRYALIDFSVYA